LLNLRFEGVSGRAVDAQSLDSLFDAQLREWRKALTEGLQPEVPGSEAAASVDLIERAYQVRQEWALPWVRRAGSNA
jgi:hypothetical protein